MAILQRTFVAGAFVLVSTVACASRDTAARTDSVGASSGAAVQPQATRAPYAMLPDSLGGDSIAQYTLVNAHGIQVTAIDYGAIITAIRTPDRTGASGDIVFGYDSLSGYLHDKAYFGAIVGRFANRIGKARFTLDGRTYPLTANDGANTLHGGKRGFDKVAWRGEPFTHGDSVGVTFRYTSRDGEEGYPGTLNAVVTYTLTGTDELIVDYQATSDKPTPVNLSQHSYWNLHGGGKGTILDHVLSLDAAHYTPVDSTLIPTGTLTPVDGTPFDFRTPTAIGARIDATDTQLRFGKGYDHNWVLDRAGREGLVHAARVVDPVSGRTLDIATTEPGIQFYSGNFLDGTVRGKGGETYVHRGALALETQHYPDSPNQKAFPSVILRPGETLRSRTVFTFGVAR